MDAERWTVRGRLPDGALPRLAAVDRSGYGLVAAVSEPAATSPTEQLMGRRGLLVRVTGAGTSSVYDAPGWIQALHLDGASAYAVAAVAKPGGGANYSLLRSLDSGLTWTAQGPIAATSVSQVLGLKDSVWLLGANVMVVSHDAGRSWRLASGLPGERNPTSERLRVRDGGVAVVGRGLATSHDGLSWSFDPVSGVSVVDLEDSYLAVVNQKHQPGVGRLEGGAVRWLSGLPQDKRPTRVTSQGATVRVLARSADPSQGVGLTVFRSDDSGASWSSQALALRAEADLSGLCGLGVSLRSDLVACFP